MKDFNDFNEFKHFKDVSTMVWNEEVTQRDMGAVVADAIAWRVNGGVRRDAQPKHEERTRVRYKLFTLGAGVLDDIDDELT